jgi:hypothetical protein
MYHNVTHQARKSALVTNIGFKPQPKAQTPIVPYTGVGAGLEYSPALRPERLPVVPKGDLVEPPGYGLGVPPLGGTLMPKLSYLHLSAAFTCLLRCSLLPGW